MGEGVKGDGELTGRMKMILMMYLVLIALLALNVSKEVLNAFVLLNKEMGRTNRNFSEKNEKTYASFVKAVAENPAKAGEWKDKAFKVKDASQSIVDLLDALKTELAMRIDKLDDTSLVNLEEPDSIDNKADLDITGNLFINQEKASLIKREIIKFRESIVDYIKPKDEKFKRSIKKNLDTSDPPMTAEGVTLSWESMNFEHLPAVAVIARMTLLQSQIRNAETEIIEYLLNEIDAGATKFNKVDAIVLPEKTYVTKGDTFRAKIFIAASDTTTPPEVFMGEYDVLGEDQFQMKPGYDTLPVQFGKALLKERTGEVGIKKKKGVLNMKTTGGLIQRPFEFEYQVGEAAVNVSPDKMNVFYVLVENPVTISVSGFQDDKIRPRISQGNLRKDGRRPSGYIVTVDNPKAPAIVTVEAEIMPSRWQNMGKKEFRVKNLPDPVASFMGIKGDGSLNKATLAAAEGLKADVGDFLFDLRFLVTSFSMSVQVAGVWVSDKSNNNRLTPKMKDWFKQMSKGSRILIEEVKAMPELQGAKPNKCPGVSIKVI